MFPTDIVTLVTLSNVIDRRKSTKSDPDRTSN